MAAGLPDSEPSNSATASSASGKVATAIFQSGLRILINSFSSSSSSSIEDEHADDDEEDSLTHQIAPRREIQQLDFRHVRMQRDLRDAGVFDVEMVRLGQRQLEQNGEHHADDAAVAEHRDVLSAMSGDDFAQARLDPLAKNFSALAARHATMVNFIEPLVRLKTELGLDRLPAEARPVAEINFPQAGQNCLLEAAALQRRRQLLLDAFHRAGVNRINRFSAQIIGENFRLPFAAGRKVHVNPPAEFFLVTRLDFAVADEQQARGGWRRRFAPQFF